MAAAGGQCAGAPAPAYRGAGGGGEEAWEQPPGAQRVAVAGAFAAPDEPGEAVFVCGTAFFESVGGAGVAAGVCASVRLRGSWSLLAHGSAAVGRVMVRSFRLGDRLGAPVGAGASEPVRWAGQPRRASGSARRVFGPRLAGAQRPAAGQGRAEKVTRPPLPRRGVG